jgi:hypothetical protein
LSFFSLLLCCLSFFGFCLWLRIYFLVSSHLS